MKNLSRRQINKLAASDEIAGKIYTIRNVQVMLASDLAKMYGVETKILNQAVKRNEARFPSAFRFQLTKDEHIVLRSQSVTLKNGGQGQHEKYRPYVFTEQGVAMLSAVLKSQTAIEVSIKIIDAFVKMRTLIQENILLFQRMEKVEKLQAALAFETNQKFKQIFNALENCTDLPVQGVFFDGQMFDAYCFVSDLIRSAKHSIILIDNYVDDTVLTLLAKRRKEVVAIIYTKASSKQLKLDIEKHNSQYPEIEIKHLKCAHDRFLILDHNKVYHIGASLKDLGKKWFAFSKIEKDALKIYERIQKEK